MNISMRDQNSRVDSLFCDSSVLLTQMRAHVGQHIIHHLYGIDKSDLKREVCSVET